MANYTSEQRLRQAEDLLKHPLLVEAFDALRNVYTDQIRKCAPSDDLGRFRYARALDDLDAVASHLHGIIAQETLKATDAEKFRKLSVVEKVIRTF